MLCIHTSIVNKKISRHTRDNHKEVGLIFLQQEYTQLGKAVDDALSQIGLFWGDRTLVSRGLGVYVCSWFREEQGGGQRTKDWNLGSPPIIL